MILTVNDNLVLELLQDEHSNELYELVSLNREYLKQWLPWVGHMQDEKFISSFIKGSVQRNIQGAEAAFAIMLNGRMAGRNGVYKIDRQNQTAEIGYWIGQQYTGHGIAARSTAKLVEYCFNQLALNRIEIRCSKDNIKSQAVPQRLGFIHEGTLRQAELVHGVYRDLELYAKLKNDG